MEINRRKSIALRLAVVALTVGAVAAPLRAKGVDAKTQKVIARGLDWLANSQSSRGHWAAGESRYPTSMTALAGNALLLEGSTTTQGKYQKNIKRAVDYLVSRARTNGLDGDPNKCDSSHH